MDRNTVYEKGCNLLEGFLITITNILEKHSYNMLDELRRVVTYKPTED